MSVSRKIKEEALTELLPDVYKPRRKPKREPRERKDVKALVKEERKKRSSLKRTRTLHDLSAIGAAAEDDVEVLGATAPRRPYQWKGRRVRKVLRPGTVISFTPGQRSMRRPKREYDEVYADEDILQSAEAREGEFAYGKRQRLMTRHNPTPSKVPVTAQLPLAAETVLPGQAKLLPTVQVLVPRRRPRATEARGRKAKVEVKMRPTQTIAPGLKVETMDVSIPVKSEESEAAVVASLAGTIKKELAADVEMAEPARAPARRKRAAQGELFAESKVARPSPVVPVPDVEMTEDLVARAAAPPPAGRVIKAARYRAPRVSPQTLAAIAESVPLAAAAAAASAAPAAQAEAAAATAAALSLPRGWRKGNQFARYHPSQSGPFPRSEKLRHLVVGESRKTADGKVVPEVVYHPSVLKRY